ncbi:MAG: methyl-accepting chemotaxis protein, partial [Comamonas sp.]
EVVGAIRRVTDIMGEISAASSEQSTGVAQVGEAITQMDQTTQQNAALVEQSAAAADSLQRQAQELVQAVAVFRLDDGHASVARVQPAVRSSAQPPAAPRKPVAVKAAPAVPSAAAPAVPLSVSSRGRPAQAGSGTDDWESF